MPHQIKLTQPPAGYSATSVKEGEKAQVIYREFLTSEDGMKLVQRLEGLPSNLLSAISKEIEIKPSQIDHLLAHFNEAGDGIVYINELKLIGEIRLKVGKEKGDAIYEKDIVDIHRVRFEGIEIPEDHGVVVVFSKGWRKGLYFDLGPLHKNLSNRDYDFWTAFGQCYNYLFFQEVHSISFETWDSLFQAEWFPFATLSHEIIKEMISWASSQHSVDEILSKVLAELSEQIQFVRERWANADLFKDHIAVLNTAIERFEAHDWISASTILYTRIEGILREIAERDQIIKLSQTTLSRAPQSFSDLPSTSRLLPDKFQEYLNNVYFKSFDPRNPSGVSRNTVGHGVAPSDAFNSKSAALGILILDQLFYHIPPTNGASVSHTGGVETVE